MGARSCCKVYRRDETKRERRRRQIPHEVVQTRGLVADGLKYNIIDLSYLFTIVNSN